MATGKEAAALAVPEPKGVRTWFFGVALVMAIVMTISSLVHFYRASNEQEQRESVAATATRCSDASAYQTRACELTAEWSNAIKFADGPEANGKNFCVFPMMRFEKTEENGTTYWRFKTNAGRHEMKYRLFPAGETCPLTL